MTKPDPITRIIMVSMNERWYTIGPKGSSSHSANIAYMYVFGPWHAPMCLTGSVFMEPLYLQRFMNRTPHNLQKYQNTMESWKHWNTREKYRNTC